MASLNVRERLKGCSDTMMNVAIGAADEAKKIVGEDPRKMVHAAKVGLAMAAISLFYCFDIFKDGAKADNGLYAMWAVNTVAIIFEFSVGGTIGKGFNRTIATLVGGALGVGAHGATSFAGNTAECILLAAIIFFISGVATFARFFPKLKARYDYCFLIIIVTFGLIAVCTYRGQKLMEMAEKRMSTALIGYATVLICCFICPCWAGQDLHNLVANNIEALATFLEGFRRKYFESPNEKSRENNEPLNGYKSILDSRSTEESLVNFAKWEPRHGKFSYWHPWDHYLKIGLLTRECACRLDALNACLDSEIQASLEIRAMMKAVCMEMSRECSSALRELVVGMKTMTCPTPTDSHVERAEAAATNMKSLLQTQIWADAQLLDVCPVAMVACLLMQIVLCTAKIANSVHELATLAKFKNSNVVTSD